MPLHLSPNHPETFMQLALIQNLGHLPKQHQLLTLNEEIIK
jgi:hypothetical protein